MSALGPPDVRRSKGAAPASRLSSVCAALEWHRVLQRLLLALLGMCMFIGDGVLIPAVSGRSFLSDLFALLLLQS
jgi:hypothetical protein